MKNEFLLLLLLFVLLPLWAVAGNSQQCFDTFTSNDDTFERTFRKRGACFESSGTTTKSRPALPIESTKPSKFNIAQSDYYGDNVPLIEHIYQYPAVETALSEVHKPLINQNFDEIVITYQDFLDHFSPSFSRIRRDIAVTGSASIPMDVKEKDELGDDPQN